MDMAFSCMRISTSIIVGQTCGPHHTELLVPCGSSSDEVVGCMSAQSDCCMQEGFSVKHAMHRYIVMFMQLLHGQVGGWTVLALHCCLMTKTLGVH